MAKPLDPEASLGRIDLPIRDVLRFVIPGGYGAISAAVIDHLLFSGGLGFANPGVLVPVGFMFGLLAFIGGFHSRFWPWRRPWHHEMDQIAIEINAITGHALARREEYAKPVYKLWIEAVSAGDLRGYLHYKTGLYYSTVAVSVYSVAGALACLGWSAWRFGGFCIDAHATSGAPSAWHFFGTQNFAIGVTGAGAYLLMAVMSYSMSRSNLNEVARHGRIAMELDSSRDELTRLARAATRTTEDLNDALVVAEIVRHALMEICPMDVELLEGVRLDGMSRQMDARNGLVSKVAHITVTSADPTELNGDAKLYEGERQRLLESAVAMRLCARLNADAVRLQIVPIADYSPNGPYQSSHKKIHVVKLEEALRRHVIEEGSLVEQCCRKYKIDRVFVRGRFVIGPSPELGEVLERELSTHKAGVRVYDPFAGTRMVERICKQTDPAAVVLSQDRMDLDGNELNVDSFVAALPTEEYDLAVIDPLYEDCLAYLDLVAPKLKVNRMIVQAGRACDLTWNEKIRTVLQKFATVESPPLNEKAHSSCIFIATRH